MGWRDGRRKTKANLFPYPCLLARNRPHIFLCFRCCQALCLQYPTAVVLRFNHHHNDRWRALLVLLRLFSLLQLLRRRCCPPQLSLLLPLPRPPALLSSYVERPHFPDPVGNNRLFTVPLLNSCSLDIFIPPYALSPT